MTSRILVVEDEAIIARDIQATLRDLGYDVPKTAATSEQALACVIETNPDLVLMDIRIQGEVDGIETAQRIREKHGTPVIYLTSYSDEATVRRAKQTGAYGYVLKPFSDRDLRTAIEVALQKRQLEQQLSERERWFTTTLKSIGDAVIATDTDQHITFMNVVAERITGWKSADAIGKDLGAVFRLVDQRTGAPLESPLTRAFREGFAVELPREVLLEMRSGGKRDVDDSAAPIIDDQGKTLGGVIVFRDVTARRQLEDRLAQTERLAAIGTLSAGMAHEINNPLSYVLTNVSFAVEEIGELGAALEKGDIASVTGLSVRLAELQQALRDAHEGGMRVHRIVENLKKFGRLDSGSAKLLELTDVVEKAISATESLVRHHAQIRREYKTAPFVEANEGALGQVFVNLLVNAVQSVEDAPIKNVVVAIYTDEAGRAVVEVRDSGAGIEPEIRRRIFDPFYTTKPVGQGSGLGLSVAHSVVRSLGGEIAIDSKLGQGSTFRVALTPARQHPVDEPVAEKSVQRARVLVIDDEPAIGRAMNRWLRAEHDVFVLTSAAEALPRIAAGETFDVVLCDLMMPQMNGMDFFLTIQKANPELAERIVFVTGGAVTKTTEDFLVQTASRVLQKPVEPATLRRVVAEQIKKTRAS